MSGCRMNLVVVTTESQSHQQQRHVTALVDSGSLSNQAFVFEPQDQPKTMASEGPLLPRYVQSSVKPAGWYGKTRRNLSEVRILRWEVYAILAACCTIIGCTTFVTVYFTRQGPDMTTPRAKWTSASAGTSKTQISVAGAPEGKDFEEPKGYLQEQVEDILINVVEQDTSNPHFPEQLTKKIVAVPLTQQGKQHVHLVVQPEMAPEVATAVAALQRASPTRLSSVRYKLTERNCTGELQVPIVPAEVVNVLWEVGHVPETSELSLTIVFGKFPEYLKELTLEIVHESVKIKVLNLAEIRELCANGRYSSGRSSDETTYLISCKVTE